LRVAFSGFGVRHAENLPAIPRKDSFLMAGGAVVSPLKTTATNRHAARFLAGQDMHDADETSESETDCRVINPPETDFLAIRITWQNRPQKTAFPLYMMDGSKHLDTHQAISLPTKQTISPRLMEGELS
jgi:hypothetical protein